jgi:murein DD-endopeptidase / murein LD-carboxypeptidase
MTGPLKTTGAMGGVLKTPGAVGKELDTGAHWSAAWLGLPWAAGGREREGCDCWGLVRLVYGAELGIDLPGYDGVSPCAAELAEIDALIAAGSGDWRQVEQPLPFDVLLFRRGRWRSHVGLHVARGRMLHMDEGGSQLADPDGPLWRSRFVGAFRHGTREGQA